jgi:hypothetical protein
MKTNSQATTAPPSREHRTLREPKSSQNEPSKKFAKRTILSCWIGTGTAQMKAAQLFDVSGLAIIVTEQPAASVSPMQRLWPTMAPAQL